MSTTAERQGERKRDTEEKDESWWRWCAPEEEAVTEVTSSVAVLVVFGPLMVRIGVGSLFFIYECQDVALRSEMQVQQQIAKCIDPYRG